MHDPLPNVAEQNCHVCNHALRAGVLFCSNCGHSIADTATLPSHANVIQSSAGIASDWSEIKRVGWLFGLLLLSSLVLGLVSRTDPSPWPDAIVSFIDAVIVLVFVGARRQDLLPLLRFPRLGAARLFELLGIALAFAVVMSVYFAILQRMGVPFLHLATSYQKSGWPIWSMLLLVSVMPAIFEELAFRGVIQSTLEHVVNDREAWLIQAALFSVLHLLPIIFPSHFLMGLCFGYIRNRSKSLYPSMVLHAAWNASVVLKEIYWT